MAADSVLSGELAALREELSASRRQRQPMHTASQATGETTTVSAGAPDDTSVSSERLQELEELLSETVKFVEEAGKNLSAHPVANMLVAFVVGIMIGRLLGRRQEL